LEHEEQRPDPETDPYGARLWDLEEGLVKLGAENKILRGKLLPRSARKQEKLSSQDCSFWF